MAMNPADTHYVRTGEPGHNWKAGDWAVTTTYGNRVQVEKVEGHKIALRFAISGTTAPVFSPADIRRETFGEYITRPTGFGGTSWGAYIGTQLLGVGVLSAGIVTIKDGGWVAIGLWAVVQTVWMVATYKNWKRTLK